MALIPPMGRLPRPVTNIRPARDIVTLPPAGGRGLAGGPPSKPSAPSRFGPAQQTQTPVSPALIQARFGPTVQINPLTLVGSTTPGANWVPIELERPTILYPIAQLEGNVHYIPLVRPFDLFGDNNPEQWSLVARNRGAAYLWAPGRWWLKYNADASAQFLLIPAEDPTAAIQFLSAAGVSREQRTGGTTGTSHVSRAHLVSFTIPARPNRLSITIQNTTVVAGGGVILHVGLTDAPTKAATPAVTDTGFQLSQRGSITFAGDSLWRGALVLIAAPGVGNTWEADWIELLGG